MEKIKAFREAVIKVLEQSGRPITYPALRVGLKKHGLSTLGLKIPVRIGAVFLGIPAQETGVSRPGSKMSTFGSGAGALVFSLWHSQL